MPQTQLQPCCNAQSRLSDWLMHVGVLVLVYLALTLPCLSTVPRFYMDEAWHGSVGYALATEGVLRHPMYQGWGGMEHRYVQSLIVLPLLSAGMFATVGFDVLTARLCSVMVGLLGIVSLYGLMRRLFGGPQAFWIAMLTLTNAWMFDIVRRVRPEPYYFAFSMAALWALLSAMQTQRRWLAVLAGVLAGLAALSHPTGLLLDAALLGGLAICMWQRGTLKTIAYAAAGLALPLIIFAAYVVWAQQQDASVSFREQMRGPHGLFEGGLANLLVMESKRWMQFLQWPKGAPLAAIIAAGYVAAWIRSKREDKAIALALTLYAILMLCTGNHTSRYLVPAVGLMAALVIRLAWRMLDGRRSNAVCGQAGDSDGTNRSLALAASQSVDSLSASGRSSARPVRGRLAKGIATGLVAVWLLMNLAGIGLVVHRSRGASIYPMLDKIAAVTGPDATVYGDEMFWMGQGRFNYMPFPFNARWEHTYDMVAVHRPAYAVRAAWAFGTSHGIDIPPKDMPTLGTNWPGQTPFQQVIDDVCLRHGTRVESFRDPCFGPIEVYRLTWPPVLTLENAKNHTKAARLYGVMQDRYSRKVQDALLPPATGYAFKYYETEDDRVKFACSFIDGYFYGLKGIGGTVTIDGGGNNPHQRGFDAGNAYRTASSRQQLTLADFGYKPLIAEGPFAVGDEQSEFHPNGDAAKWWVEFQQDAKYSYAKKHDLPIGQVFKRTNYCKFKGYLAPDCGFGVGHFNMYDREFLVIEILQVK